MAFTFQCHTSIYQWMGLLVRRKAEPQWDRIEEIVKNLFIVTLQQQQNWTYPRLVPNCSLDFVLLCAESSFWSLVLSSIAHYIQWLKMWSKMNASIVCLLSVHLSACSCWPSFYSPFLHMIYGENICYLQMSSSSSSFGGFQESVAASSSPLCCLRCTFWFLKLGACSRALSVLANDWLQLSQPFLDGCTSLSYC